MEPMWRSNSHGQVLPAEKRAPFSSGDKIITKLHHMVQFQYSKIHTEKYIKEKYDFTPDEIENINWQGMNGAISKL